MQNTRANERRANQHDRRAVAACLKHSPHYSMFYKCGGRGADVATRAGDVDVGAIVRGGRFAHQS